MPTRTTKARQHDLIDHAISRRGGPLYGLTRKQAGRIFDWMQTQGLFEDHAPKPVLCNHCSEERQVVAAPCPSHGCLSPTQESPPIAKREMWCESLEAYAQAAEAELAFLKRSS
jgi:hypothetical protein